MRNFFCFGVMKVMPVSLQNIIYNSGKYNQADSSVSDTVQYSNQEYSGTDTAQGLNGVFMKPYNALANLSTMTKIDEGEENTFLMFTNNATHELQILQMPECEPSYYVDNTEYNKTFNSRPTVNGVTLTIEGYEQYVHWQINVAAMKKVGAWLDYLREQGVYDNTRIIIASDHGRNTQQVSDLVLSDVKTHYNDLLLFYPTLLVKDFGATEFTVSEEFMTNADVPTLATKDVIDSPVNPFTGKPITNTQKTEREQFVTLSGDWNTATNNGTQFLPSSWLSVKGDLWDRNSWKYYPKVEVMPKPAQ